MSEKTDSDSVALEECMARLVAAERVCLLYGWNGARAETEHDKATTQAWMEWHHLVPGNFSEPRNHPELNDEGIARLAQKRDEIRERTLARIRETSSDQRNKRVNQPTIPDTVDRNAAAQILGVEPRKVTDWARRGTIPARKVGIHWRFSRRELHETLAKWRGMAKR